MQFEPLSFQRGELLRRVAGVETAIRSGNACPAAPEDLGQRQHPRTADPDEEERAGQQVVDLGDFFHATRAMTLPGVRQAG